MAKLGDHPKKSKIWKKTTRHWALDRIDVNRHFRAWVKIKRGKALFLQVKSELHAQYYDVTMLVRLLLYFFHFKNLYLFTFKVAYKCINYNMKDYNHSCETTTINYRSLIYKSDFFLFAYTRSCVFNDSKRKGWCVSLTEKNMSLRN